MFGKEYLHGRLTVGQILGEYKQLSVITEASSGIDFNMTYLNRTALLCNDQSGSGLWGENSNCSKAVLIFDKQTGSTLIE